MDNRLENTADTIYKKYWKANLIVVSLLLFLWFLVSFVFGIILADDLNTKKFFGFKLGFWWAHQGSIFIFVLIIFAYSHIMKLVDKHYSDRTMDAGKQ